MDKIEGVLLTPLKQIFHPKGDIFHGMKRSDAGFAGFGEAYFSTIAFKEIKGWKKHTKMTLNLVVPVGEIRFVIYDDRKESKSCGDFLEVSLSALKNYQRLTVPPGVWMAFEGVGEGQNMLLNIASIEHDPNEAVAKSLDEIAYDWRGDGKD